MPDRRADMEKGWARLYRPMAEYAACIDLLRNEKPVYIRILDRWVYCGLFAGPEPAGEGEEHSIRGPVD